LKISFFIAYIKYYINIFLNNTLSLKFSQENRLNKLKEK